MKLMHVQFKFKVPKSKALMKDLVGDQVDMDNIPFYGLAKAKVGGRVV